MSDITTERLRETRLLQAELADGRTSFERRDEIRRELLDDAIPDLIAALEAAWAERDALRAKLEAAEERTLELERILASEGVFWALRREYKSPGGFYDDEEAREQLLEAYYLSERLRKEKKASE